MAREERRSLRNQDGYRAGGDAAYIKPKLIPDDELIARDDSGGPDWDPYTMQFGDGGYVTGEKGHLSAHGGPEDEVERDEISTRPRAKSAMEAGREKAAAPDAPARSRREARE
ncbi:MAG TPA: hypothetical protein VKP66_18990 [Steroidobacteraceae bacterium]|nr:hypothetical protein [Steroidobacteraceae bacterium]